VRLPRSTGSGRSLHREGAQQGRRASRRGSLTTSRRGHAARPRCPAERSELRQLVPTVVIGARMPATFKCHGLILAALYSLIGKIAHRHCAHWPGRPGALLRPAPLRTGRARFHASGSSKPVGVDRLVVLRREAASLGPFTAEAASNLSSGSDSSSTSSWGSPDPRLRPFGPGHQARYPASYPAPAGGGASHHGPGFLLPFGRRH
jgi:hypothetical protein